MAEKETILFGIPVPSDNTLFLAIVVIHILLGIICVLTGATAMLSRKGSTIHIASGKVYFWGLLLVFVTVMPLTIMRWPHNNHLFVLGVLSILLGYIGRRAAQKPKQGWPRIHTICMGASYIILLTAFYVDNGKHLPFWNQFSQLFFWIFPSMVGLPVIIYAIFMHPLNRRNTTFDAHRKT